MATTVGSVEWVGSIDGKRMLADARTLGKQAAKELDKSFDKEFAAFHDRMSGRFSKLGSELGAQMRRSGDLSGINFTGALERVVQRSLSGLADDIAEAFGTPDGLRNFASQFETVDDAAADMRKRLAELNEAGGLNDQMWRRLGGTLNQFVGEQRKVERASADQRAEANRLAIDLAELHVQFDEDKQRNVNALAIEMVGLNEQFNNQKRAQVNGLAIEMAGLNDQFDLSKRQGVNGLAIEMAELNDQFENDKRANINQFAIDFSTLSSRMNQTTDESGNTSGAVGRLASALGGANQKVKDVDGSMFGWWKNMRTNGRQIVLISAAIVGGMEQAATLVGSLGPAITVLGTATLALGTGAGVMIAGFQGMLGEMKDIEKAARPVAKEMQLMGDSFEEMQDRIQAAMFDGLAPAFESIRTKLLPTLTAGFEETAGTINKVMQGVADDLTSPEGLGKIETLLSGFQPIITDLSKGLTDLVAAVGDVLVVSLPFVQDFASEFADLMAEFRAWTSSPDGGVKIAEWFKDGMRVMGGLLDLTAEISKQFGKLVTPEATDRTMRLIETLILSMEPLFDVFESLGKLDVFGVLATALNLVLQAVQPLVLALGPLLEMIGNGLIMSMNILTPVLEIVVALLIGPLRIAFEIINSVVTALTEYLTPLVVGFQEVADLFTGVAENIWIGIKPAIDDLLASLIGMLPSQEEMGRILREEVIPAVEDFTQWVVDKAVPAINDFALWLKNEAIPAMQDFVHWIKTEVVPRIEKFIEKVNEVVESMGGWDNIIATLVEVGASFFSFSSMVMSALSPVLNIIRVIQAGISGLNNIKITAPRLVGGGDREPGMASGGIVQYGARRLIGESGKEAVVPLERPLNQVDPSVRALSAYAQGLNAPGGGGGRSIVVQEGAFTVVSPSADPQMVANAVLDRVVSQLV